MDEKNISDLKGLAPKDSKAKLELFGSYDPEKELIIRDPYYVSNKIIQYSLILHDGNKTFSF